MQGPSAMQPAPYPVPNWIETSAPGVAGIAKQISDCLHQVYTNWPTALVELINSYWMDRPGLTAEKWGDMAQRARTNDTYGLGENAHTLWFGTFGQVTYADLSCLWGDPRLTAGQTIPPSWIIEDIIAHKFGIFSRKDDVAHAEDPSHRRSGFIILPAAGTPRSFLVGTLRLYLETRGMSPADIDTVYCAYSRDWHWVCTVLHRRDPGGSAPSPPNLSRILAKPHGPQCSAAWMWYTQLDSKSTSGEVEDDKCDLLCRVRTFLNHSGLPDLDSQLCPMDCSSLSAVTAPPTLRIVQQLGGIDCGCVMLLNVMLHYVQPTATTATLSAQFMETLLDLTDAWLQRWSRHWTFRY